MNSDKYIRQADNKGAVLNTDNDGLAAYRKRKKVLRAQEQRITNLEQQLLEIKQLLLQQQVEKIDDN